MLAVSHMWVVTHIVQHCWIAPTFPSALYSSSCVPVFKCHLRRLPPAIFCKGRGWSLSWGSLPWGSLGLFLWDLELGLLHSSHNWGLAQVVRRGVLCYPGGIDLHLPDFAPPRHILSTPHLRCGSQGGERGGRGDHSLVCESHPQVPSELHH